MQILKKKLTYIPFKIQSMWSTQLHTYNSLFLSMYEGNKWLSGSDECMWSRYSLQSIPSQLIGHNRFAFMHRLMRLTRRMYIRNCFLTWMSFIFSFYISNRHLYFFELYNKLNTSGTDRPATTKRHIFSPMQWTGIPAPQSGILASNKANKTFAMY